MGIIRKCNALWTDELTSDMMLLHFFKKFVAQMKAWIRGLKASAAVSPIVRSVELREFALMNRELNF